MELGAALKRVGAQIVKQKIADPTEEQPVGSATHFLRIHPDHGDRWSELVQELILSSLGKKKFGFDVSKYFYASHGKVCYLWRVVTTGDVVAALDHWSQVALQVAASRSPEITSIPLIGRANYEFDPARGKLKGGHDIHPDQAAGLVSLAASGGIQT